MKSFEEVRDIFNDAAVVKPDAGYWGIHVNERVSGFNVFYWGENKDKLLDLLLLFPIFFLVGDNPDKSDIDFMENLSGGLKSGSLDIQKAIEQFEDHFKDYEILWCAPFEDLLNGDGSSPRWVRSMFWSEQEQTRDSDEDNESPIPSELEDEFAEMISEWSSKQ